jgi:hypothetical protein
MMQSQTITGLFATIGDAQQAVQFLLGNGFMAEHIAISEQRAPQAADKKDVSPTAEERNTGRFLVSLFGSRDEVGSTSQERIESEKNASYKSGTRVTVRVQTALEANQAVGFLKRASAVNVSKVD